MGKSKNSKAEAIKSAAETNPTPDMLEGSKEASHAVTVEEKSLENSVETSFESFYLKQITAEFADDLDKLRNAPDFSEKSVPVLVDALKATARNYNEEEKAKVMGRE
ncbi:MAG: hypothetical protein Q9218_001288 [Villophora microphyllina]